jgi:phosphatidylserine/phosphatidylglycerophosphate/cardiolipin synthase-like enzyme
MTNNKRGSSGRKRTVAATSAAAIVLLLVSVLVLAFLEGRGLLDFLSALIGFVQGTSPLETPGGGWYQVYFTSPQYPDEEEDHFGGIDEKLVALINDAQSSIDVAAYELDLENVADALIKAHEDGVAVRLVTDTDNVDETAVQNIRRAGIPVVDDDRNSIMHDKFVIIDGDTVLTGSWNLTENGTYRNNNNAIVIHSTALAENYETEFEEMFVNKEFGPDAFTETPNRRVSIMGEIGEAEMAIVENYFAPEDEVTMQIVEHLQEADQSVYFMAFSFTDDRIGKLLLDRYTAGLEVKGVFEKRGSDVEYGEYTPMRDLGIDVLVDGNPYIMHHKVFIIDEEKIILGSFNFTRSADRSNDENILIITHPGIAQAYMDEFQRIYAQASTGVE